jgi:hypothetical protein
MKASRFGIPNQLLGLPLVPGQGASPPSAPDPGHFVHEAGFIVIGAIRR